MLAPDEDSECDEGICLLQEDSKHPFVLAVSADHALTADAQNVRFAATVQLGLDTTDADPKSQGLATDFTVLQKSSDIGVQVLLSYQQADWKAFACECARQQM